MQTVLVTGGAGFIGSNFVRHLLRTSEYEVLNLDALTYAGNLENLTDCEENERYHFIHANICDRDAIAEVFSTHRIDAVVNFAAESHVDRSIEDPELFLRTNVFGTQVLLDAALHAWRTSTHDKYCREYRGGVKFLQVSTDEVYGSLSSSDPCFRETNPLLPNSPYSASKASADMFVRAYHETYGLPINITRCSNNYGPYQFPEKLIPLITSNAMRDKRLPVYGDGLQIRDWLHVEDHCSGIKAVLERGEVGEVYNIGGNNEIANIDLVKRILAVLSKDESLIEFVADRPGHDRRYAIDNSKMKRELDWEPSYTFERGIEHAVGWYLDNPEWTERVLSGSYREYYHNMYSRV